MLRNYLIPIFLFSSAIPAYAKIDYTFNGFASVVAGIQNKSSPSYLLLDTKRVYDNSLTAKADSRAGLQGSVLFNEQISATAQVTVHSYDDYKAKVEWAFLSYNPNEIFLLRAGRLRYPLFIYSDFVDVGYAYPWITPPTEVYRLPFDNLDSLDFIFFKSYKNVDNKLRLFFGEIRDQKVHTTGQEKVNVSIEDNFGISWQTSYQGWTFKLSYTRAKIDLSSTASGKIFEGMLEPDHPNIAAQLKTCDKAIQFASAGIKYDSKNYFGTAEATYAKTKNSVLPTEQRGYIMLGKKIIPKLSAFVTFAFADDKAKDLISGTSLESLDDDNPLKTGVKAAQNFGVMNRISYTLGSRWDLNTNFAFKAEINHAVNESTNNINLYRVAVDATF